MRGCAKERAARAPHSAVPDEAEAREAKGQQGPGGWLWNCGGRGASGDHDFRVAVGGEERADALENSVFEKCRVETRILG